MKAILKNTGDVVDYVGFDSSNNEYVYILNGNRYYCNCSSGKYEDLFENVNRYDLFKSVLSAMIGNKSMDLYSEEQHDEIIKTSLIITDKALKALNND